MRVYIKTLDKFGTVIEPTPEGWTWIQVEAEPGVNHKHLAGATEFEEA